MEGTEHTEGRGPGTTRVSRVGFGVSPKRTFRIIVARETRDQKKSVVARRDDQHARRVWYPDLPSARSVPSV